MSPQAAATALLLPPLLFVLLALAAVLVIRSRAAATLLVAGAMAGILVLATPFAAGMLRTSLERHAVVARGAEAADRMSPGAIVILSAEGIRNADGSLSPGPLSLERMAAGALLARRTGLPVLVTGGPLSPGGTPIAGAMAQGMATTFAIPPRWIEPAARDTAENARNSAALLRREGIAAAYVVTHGWHMPRSLEAFARTDLAALPFPVRIGAPPDGHVGDWMPRPDHLAESWFMIREWVGIVVYRLRDG
jgi:uncharacterized SAM-binding protein YcdF (DUF218 family)